MKLFFSFIWLGAWALLFFAGQAAWRELRMDHYVRVPGSVTSFQIIRNYGESSGNSLISQRPLSAAIVHYTYQWGNETYPSDAIYSSGANKLYSVKSHRSFNIYSVYNSDLDESLRRDFGILAAQNRSMEADPAPAPVMNAKLYLSTGDFLKGIEAQSSEARYVVPRTVQVYVDPDSPEFNFLIRNSNTKIIAGIVGALGFFLLSSFALKNVLSRRDPVGA